MDPKVLQWAVIALVFLAQAILVALRIIEKRNGTKIINNPSNNPKLGERVASLETNMKNVKEDIQEIKRKLNRK